MAGLRRIDGFLAAPRRRDKRHLALPHPAAPGGADVLAAGSVSVSVCFRDPDRHPMALPRCPQWLPAAEHAPDGCLSA
jgi:hypothetical protein